MSRNTRFSRPINFVSSTDQTTANFYEASRDPRLDASQAPQSVYQYNSQYQTQRDDQFSSYPYSGTPQSMTQPSYNEFVNYGERDPYSAAYDPYDPRNVCIRYPASQQRQYYVPMHAGNDRPVNTQQIPPPKHYAKPNFRAPGPRGPHPMQMNKSPKITNQTMGIPAGSNPLQILYSRNIHADWKFEDAANSKTPSFIASMSHQGKTYSGQASSKKQAQYIAAQNLLQDLGYPVPTSNSEEAANPKNISDLYEYIAAEKIPFKPDFIYSPAGPPFRCSLTANGLIFDAFASNKKAAKCLVAEKVLTALKAKQITFTDEKEPQGDAAEVVRPAKRHASTENPDAEDGVLPAKMMRAEDPVSHITLLFPNITWNFDQEGPSHKVTITAYCTDEEGHVLASARDGSKKKAKHAACMQMLSAIEGGSLVPPKINKAKSVTTESDSQLSDGDTSLSALSELNPITKVHQMFPEISWTYKQTGPPHAPAITAIGYLQDNSYEAMSGSKKVAKLEACRKVLEALASGELLPPPAPEGRNKKTAANNLFKYRRIFGPPDFQISNINPPSTDEIPLIGADGHSAYSASINIEGVLYQEMGDTEAEAKENLIEKILDLFNTGTIQQPIIRRFTSKFAEPIEVSNCSTGFAATFTIQDKTFTVSGMDTEEICRREMAKKVLEALEKKEIKATRITSRKAEKEMKESAQQPAAQTPLSILNEILGLDAVEMEVHKEDIIGAPFIASAELDGKQYNGSGKSKSSAKQACAAVILAEKFNYQFDVGNFDDNHSEIERGDIGALNPQALSAKVQSLVMDQYHSLTDYLGTYSQRKVLAGCVMTTGDDIDSAQVLAVAAGTKCIEGGELSMTGEAVNDMHAEILVRRALKKFLYKEIEKVKSNSPSILEQNTSENEPPYRLSEGIRFHLFISSPPCGDSRIFTASSQTISSGTASDNRDSNPNRQSRGQLRVKIENGQGTVLLSQSERSGGQMWDAILAGERYLNMSCSDKVARWTILGFQGALLSNLLKPVYFSSFVLGSMFHQEHLYRGLYGRFKEIVPVESFPSPFHPHCPEVIGPIVPELRNATKAPAHAVIWQTCGNIVEILETRRGRVIQGQPSSVCKKALLECYSKVCDSTKSELNYHQEKKAATIYQTLKDNLYKAIEAAGFGIWVGKPLEQDDFTLSQSMKVPIKPM